MVTVLSTFAGCGGSSLGYKMAGYTEILAIEWDRNAVETFKLNFPDIPIWQKDIKEVTGEEILKFCKIQKGELDLLDGSPPCQGFSTAGKRQVIDPRNDLFNEFVRLIKDLQPKVFVMENVSSMVKGKMKGRFKEIILELKSTGYNVKCKKLNTMWYGVPQSRERLIFIGVRKDLRIEPSYPEPLVVKPITIREAFNNLVTDTREAFELTPKYIKPLLRQMRDYEVASKYSNGVRYFNHKRNSINRPSRTILKTPDTYHHKEDRLLTSEELKIVSSYPLDFKFIGGLRNVYNRIGNSVPPKFMEAIAGHIKREILEYENRQT